MPKNIINKNIKKGRIEYNLNIKKRKQLISTNENIWYKQRKKKISKVFYNKNTETQTDTHSFSQVYSRSI